MIWQQHELQGCRKASSRDAAQLTTQGSKHHIGHCCSLPSGLHLPGRVSLIQRHSQPGRLSQHSHLLTRSLHRLYVDPKVLTTRIQQSVALEELVELFHSYQDSLDYIHLCACTCHAAHLYTRQARGTESELYLFMDRVAQRLSPLTEALPARALANCIWAWGKVGHRPQVEGILVRFIQRYLHVVLHTDQVKSQELTNVWVSLARLGLYEKEWLGHLCSLSRQFLPNFTGQELSNTMWALAVLGHHDGAFLECLCGVMATKLPLFKPQELSITLWAVAKVDIDRCPSVVDDICLVLEQNTEPLQAQEVANALWALGNMGKDKPVLVERLCRVAERRAGELKDHELAMALWGLARLKHYIPDTVSRLCQAAAGDRLTTMNQQAVAMLVWALTWLDHVEPGIYQHVCRMSEEELQRFSGPSLFIVLWGLVKTGQHNQEFVARVCQVAREKLDETDGDQLSMLIWALARSGYRDMVMVCEICRRVESNIKQLGSPLQFCNVLWALARFGHKDREVIGKLVAGALTMLPKFNAQELVNLVGALAMLDYKDTPEFMEEWSREVKGKLEQVSHCGLVRMSWSLVKLSHFDPVLTSRLNEVAMENLEDFALKDLVNLCAALGKLKALDGLLLDALCQRFLGQPEVVSGRLRMKLVGVLVLVGDGLDRECLVQIWQEVLKNLAKLGTKDVLFGLWALTKLKWTDKGLVVGALCKEVERKLTSASATQLSRLFYLLGKLDHYDKPLVTRLCREAVRKLTKFPAAELSWVLWGLARLKHSDTVLVSGVLHRLLDVMSDCPPKELSQILWALASMGQYRALFVEQVCDKALEKICQFNNLELTSLLWSLARLGHQDFDLVNKLCETVRLRVNGFNPQNLANTVWALAKLGHADRELLDVLCAEAKQQLASFTPRGLSNLVWSLAKLNYYDRCLVTGCCQEAVKKLDIFSPRELCCLMSAMARFKHHNQQLLDSFCITAKGKLRDFTICDIVSALWALAALRHYDGVFTTEVCTVSRRRVRAFKPQELSSLLLSLRCLGHPDTLFT